MANITIISMHMVRNITGALCHAMEMLNQALLVSPMTVSHFMDQCNITQKGKEKSTTIRQDAPIVN